MTAKTQSDESRVTHGVKELIAEANAAVRTYSPDEAIDRLDEDGVVFVDVRDAEELVFYCAAGARSALAAERAHEMGLEHVAHIEGGFPAWMEADGATQSAEDSVPQ